MKTTLSVVLATVLAITPALAQRNGGGGGGGGGGRGAGGGGNQGGGNSGGQDGSQQSSDNGQYSPAAVAERLVNSDNWNMDSENGVFTWKGSKFDIGNNLIVRARFERYLEAPGDAAASQQYQQILEKIKGLLAVNADGSSPSPENVVAAFAALGDAAKFPEDGGESETLQRLIYNTWEIRDDLKQKEQDHNDMDQQRKDQQDTLAQNNDAVANDLNMALEGTDSSGNQQPAAATATRGAAAGRAANQNQNQGSSTGGVTAGTSGATVNGNTTVPNGSNSSSSTPSLGSLPTLPGSTASPSIPALSKATYSTFTALELARKYAQMGLLEGKMTAEGVQAKLQFQTQIVEFMMSRRFQHSLIAGQFYNEVFKGSEQAMDAAKAEMSKFIDMRDVTPTVDFLESLSHEAISDTDTGMGAVNSSYDRGDRWASLLLLQQTFLLGEMLPAVQEFDPAKRQVLSQLYHEANDLKHMMDLHDYAAADSTLTKIQADASDFPVGPVKSGISEAEQTSNLALLSAKQALLTNNPDDAKDGLQKAIELWPLNPAIKNTEEQIAGQLDVSTTLTPEFDELMKEQDYRKIYDKRSDFGMAFLTDPDRVAKLRDVVERVGKIDMLVAYANEALAQNNGYVAWEQLANAAKLDANDPVLARTQAQVAPQVANFVEALNEAERADKAGQYAASLNNYLAAQDIYPASQLCRIGIDNVSKEILAKLNPEGPSAKALEADQAAQAAADAAAQAAANPAPAAAPATSPATPASDSLQDGTTTTTAPASNARPSTASTNASGLSPSPTAAASSPAAVSGLPQKALF
jgi:hypothetical protein